jgi:hypothetical protein
MQAQGKPNRWMTRALPGKGLERGHHCSFGKLASGALRRLHEAPNAVFKVFFEAFRWFRPVNPGVSSYRFNSSQVADGQLPEAAR